MMLAYILEKSAKGPAVNTQKLTLVAETPGDIQVLLKMIEAHYLGSLPAKLARAFRE